MTVSSEQPSTAFDSTPRVADKGLGFERFSQPVASSTNFHSSKYVQSSLHTPPTVVGYNYTSAHSAVPAARHNYSSAPTTVPVSHHYLPPTSRPNPHNAGTPCQSHYPGGMTGGWSGYGVPPPFQQPVSLWCFPPWPYPVVPPPISNPEPSAQLRQDLHRSYVPNLQDTTNSVQPQRPSLQVCDSSVGPDLAVHNLSYADRSMKPKQPAT